MKDQVDNAHRLALDELGQRRDNLSFEAVAGKPGDDVFDGPTPTPYLLLSAPNRWVLGLVDAWRRDGGRLIANGGISASDIVTALDATESS
jgi:hypothetical protein